MSHQTFLSFMHSAGSRGPSRFSSGPLYGSSHDDLEDEPVATAASASPPQPQAASSTQPALPTSCSCSRAAPSTHDVALQLQAISQSLQALTAAVERHERDSKRVDDPVGIVGTLVRASASAAPSPPLVQPAVPTPAQHEPKEEEANDLASPASLPQASTPVRDLLCSLGAAEQAHSSLLEEAADEQRDEEERPHKAGEDDGSSPPTEVFDFADAAAEVEHASGPIEDPAPHMSRTEAYLDPWVNLADLEEPWIEDEDAEPSPAALDEYEEGVTVSSAALCPAPWRMGSKDFQRVMDGTKARQVELFGTGEAGVDAAVGGAEVAEERGDATDVEEEEEEVEDEEPDVLELRIRLIEAKLRLALMKKRQLEEARAESVADEE
ncbi:hypothetical protein JCM10207_008687 [Rhodosporidiobolus poonsookiae]